MHRRAIFRRWQPTSGGSDQSPRRTPFPLRFGERVRVRCSAASFLPAPCRSANRGFAACSRVSDWPPETRPGHHPGRNQSRKVSEVLFPDSTVAPFSGVLPPTRFLELPRRASFEKKPGSKGYQKLSKVFKARNLRPRMGRSICAKLGGWNFEFWLLKFPPVGLLRHLSSHLCLAEIFGRISCLLLSAQPSVSIGVHPWLKNSR